LKNQPILLKKETTMADHETIATQESGFIREYLIKNIHFIIMIVLSVIGTAYTNISAGTSLWYWQLMAIIFCLICIVSQWSRSPRLELIRTQLLHWGVCLVAMRLLFLPALRQVLTDNVTGLILLLLMAMSTFLAGVYLDLRLTLVGIFLGICVFLIAYIDRAGLFMVMIAIILLILGLFLEKIIAKYRRQSD
jgi:hypothetical protein